MPTTEASKMHDRTPASIANLYHEELAKLTLTELAWTLKDIAIWTESCSGMEREDWDSFKTHVEDFSECLDSDALDLMLSRNWEHPEDAFGLIVAIAYQISEGLYQPDENES
jgi:hypothetical protein